MYYENKMEVLSEIFGTSEIRLGAASLNVSENCLIGIFCVLNEYEQR